MNSRLVAKGFWGSLLFLVGTALCATVPPMNAAGDSPANSGNPYAVIVERNIFHLNPPPPPPEPEKPKVELPVVKITGFVNIGNHRTVLFQGQPKDKKTGVIYYSLIEGEKSFDGKLELVRIHPSEDGVDVLNDGTAVTLTVKDDTLGAVAGAASAPPPGQRERPPGFNPGGMPGRPMAHPPGVPGMPGFSIPHRRNLPQ